MIIKYKICNSCKNSLLVNNFYIKKNRTKLSAFSNVCKSCHKRIAKEKRIANPKKEKERHKKNYQKHKNIMQERNKKWRTAKRLEIINILGGKCIDCGFSDNRALQVDHINGGGNRERKSSITGVNYLLKDIKLNPLKYQLLCANCNWIKREKKREYAL